MRRSGPLLAGLVALALAGTASAEPFRTLIMVDASSSMRRTDPQKLRKVAAELYVDLARDGDYVAVWQFDAQAKDVAGGFHQITGPQVRDRLKDAIRAISDDGDWTDFGAAFSAAGQAFGPPQPLGGEKRFLVFLTDGRCEPAPEEPRYLREGEKPEKGRKASEERETRCKQFVLSHALPTLQGVEAEVVGLSKGAPREFLHEAARRTGGRAVVTERAEDLPHLFATIHAFNSGARATTPKGVEIPVERLVASLDVVVVAGKDLEVGLRRPDGSDALLDERSAYTVRSERYRFFHVPKPVVGAWRLACPKKLPAGAVTAIQNFDLSLQLTAPEHATAGTPFEVRVQLAAGEGGGSPEESFVSRHRFVAHATLDGKLTELPLSVGPEGVRVAQVLAEKPGTVELAARVEPGPDGALTRVARPLKVTVVPPLVLAAREAFSLGEVKPGTKHTRSLDLSSSQFLGDVRLQVRGEGMPLEVKPSKVDLKVDERRFEFTFSVPDGTVAGPVSGEVRLTPSSKPYEGREGLAVKVAAVVVPLTFWEAHGTKVILAALVLLVIFVVLGFKTPARFPKKIRVFYEDKPNSDDGDFGLWLRAKPGFYRPATFRIGGGGPIRRSSALLCEIVATRDGILLRPARGKPLRSADGEERTAPFRPEFGEKYVADEGLKFWIGKEAEDE